MHAFRAWTAAVAFLAPFAAAAALTTNGSSDGQICEHSPNSRRCWAAGLTIDDDATHRWPNTGRIIEYNFDITNTTCNPDGHGPRVCLLINNQYPGPVVSGSWGDTVRITVTNHMQNNGTEIHWHGLRQLGTNPMDGTNGITSCPIAPGGSKTYTFQLTQHGTSWYHSHFSAQWGDGVFGPIVVHGPATADYDVDLGSMMLSDWFYQTAFQTYYTVNANLQLLPTGDLAASGPPPAENILINGTGKSLDGQGEFFTTTLKHGQRYRLRLINGAIDNQLLVTLDGHPFEVIAADFVPVQPFTTTQLLLNNGQRYDVIITANQSIGNYWFHANVSDACRSFNQNRGRAIFSYEGSEPGEPDEDLSELNATCDDPQLVPWVPESVPREGFESAVQTLEWDALATGPTAANENIVFWSVNGSSIKVELGEPILSSIYHHGPNATLPAAANVVNIPHGAEWTYWIIQEPEDSLVPIPHPVHLHGHDFFILGHGSGLWNASVPLNFDNPPRRDTATLPSGGWLLLAFKADNPGAWLMHCHIAWHVSQGLAVTFLEGRDQIPSKPDGYDETCTAWNAYAEDAFWGQSDSGL
ncbi:Multicopper oxidase type 1 [Lasiodiplodia theobromae]|nr:Multicopper oxidase type 1 [Lasiodiplodia theobromae]